MRGKVSFIITYYKKGKTFLMQSMNSVLVNMKVGDELIIVDDCSGDEVVQSMQIDGMPISILNSSRNLGPGGARNLGLAHASNDYVQFLDADDLLHPERTRILRNVLDSKSDLELVAAGYSTFTEKCEYAADLFDEKQVLQKNVTDVSYLPWAALFRRSFLGKVGSFSLNRRWMDLEYHARIAATIKKVSYLDLPLYAYRLEVPNQISSISRDSDGEAFKSFSQALKHLGLKKSKAWLYPLATTLARQSRREPISRRKMKAFFYPIILAPDGGRIVKWTVWALLNFFISDTSKNE